MDDIRRSDDFIEALSSGRPVVPQDNADAALAALLGGWRNETRWPPDTGLISEPQAIAALSAGLAEKPVREPRSRPAHPTRHRRGLSVVGAAAAAVLCIGGFGAVVSGAGPGDSLYVSWTPRGADGIDVRTRDRWNETVLETRARASGAKPGARTRKP